MKHIALTMSLLLVSGCSLSQKPGIPDTTLPQGSGLQENEKLLMNDKWWENFHDKELDLFVNEALGNNSDLKIAALKTLRFREFLNIKKSEQLPTIDAYGSAAKTQSYMVSFDRGFRYEQFDVGAMASFELDLWGRLKNSKMACLLYTSPSPRD